MDIEYNSSVAGRARSIGFVSGLVAATVEYRQSFLSVALGSGDEVEDELPT